MPIAHIPDPEQKFKELILYVSQKCASHSKFGATKLNKILFFADFLRYAESGQSITGAEYQHLQWGPAPRRLAPIREEMKASCELAVQPVHFPNGTQQRPVNLREPDLDLFSAREVAVIDHIIKVLEDANAEQVSDLTHGLVGWKVTTEKETIPYETFFVSDDELTTEEIIRGQQIAAEVGAA